MYSTLNNVWNIAAWHQQIKFEKTMGKKMSLKLQIKFQDVTREFKYEDVCVQPKKCKTFLPVQLCMMHELLIPQLPADVA